MEYELSVEDDDKETTAAIAKEDYLASNADKFVLEYNGVKMPAVQSEYTLGYDQKIIKKPSTSTSSSQFSPGYIALICICIVLLLVVIFGIYMVILDYNE